jgi:hypothetical protein
MNNEEIEKTEDTNPNHNNVLTPTVEDTGDKKRMVIDIPVKMFNDLEVLIKFYRAPTLSHAMRLTLEDVLAGISSDTWGEYVSKLASLREGK